ncbi:MAG: hypothetical protein ABS79_04895 [Planctomycetes bacterium SCN 63-9]|nr:MAG: hypothetical protein ABS79_04895 [Planctomycetes bacterium SCN 63-9]
MAAPYHALVESIFRRLYGPPFDRGEAVWNRGDGGRSPELDGQVPEGCSGLVMMADGVGGLDLCGTALRYVLGSLGSKLAVSVVPWGHGFGRWHADLTRVENRDAWARAIANAAGRFREEHPNSPIFLVAKSGGSGVMIRALEYAPPDCIDRVILLAPALSPSYDLSAALRGVRREVYVFWSPLDVVILGAGTRIFGTIDRVRSVSAGLVGFRPPRKQSSKVVIEAASAEDQGYLKLHQVRWKPSMMRTGYFGGHMGTDSPSFLKIYVAPLLRPE